MTLIFCQKTKKKKFKNFIKILKKSKNQNNKRKKHNLKMTIKLSRRKLKLVKKLLKFLNLLKCKINKVIYNWMI